MQKIDLRQYKKEQRAKYRDRRARMEPSLRSWKDQLIARRVRGLYQYKDCYTVLTYVSTPTEVDTHEIILGSLADGKRVAVPRCIPGTNEMEFFYITSMDDLREGSYKLLEPDPRRCEKLDAARTQLAKGCICIVPGFVFDFDGYRIGYGKGYYDRFLNSWPCVKIGICYSECVKYRLLRGRYDIAVDLLITDRYLKRTGQP